MRVGLYLKGDHTADKYSQSLYLMQKMKEDPRFKTYFIIDDKFYEDGLRSILETGYGEVIKFDPSVVIGDNRLDVVIIIDPYPPIPPVKYRDWETPIVFKEYGTTGIDNGYHRSWRRSVSRFSDLIITDNKSVCSEINEFFNSDKCIVGSPAYDYKFDITKIENNKTTILWTPHHSVIEEGFYNNIIGGRYSTFLTYKDFIPNLTKMFDIKLYVKIHPLTPKRYRKYCRVNKLHNDYDEYIDLLHSMDNVEVLSSDVNYHEVFMESDAMLNDSISFLQEYLPTNNPMLVLYDEGRSKYNSYGESLIDKCYYRAHDESDILKFIERVISGNDPKKEDRKEFFDKNYYINPAKPNSYSLLDIIYDRYKKKV